MKYLLCSFSVIIYTFLLHNCAVDEVCYNDKDCTDNQTCINESCQYECQKNSDCAYLFDCVQNKCVLAKAAQTISCPAGMVNVENHFCMDKYEASKPDASETSAGSDTSYAAVQANVFPWMASEPSVAVEACSNAGKRLCTPAEWQFACESPQSLVYAYGNTYNPTICNGIDSMEDFRLTPTGYFTECKNYLDIFDLNGNLWEYTSDATIETIRGGAFNCLDSKTLHRCTYIPTSWQPSARGFRCCYDGDPN